MRQEREVREERWISGQVAILIQKPARKRCVRSWEHSGVRSAGALPEVQRGQQWRLRIAQQSRQSLCALGPKPPPAAERQRARPFAPHAAHQPHAPIR
jgi:hypothetical protein